MRSNNADVETDGPLTALFAVGEDAPSQEEKALLLDMIAQSPPEARGRFIRRLASRIDRLSQGLAEARGIQAQLAGKLQKLTAAPLYPAVFLESVGTLGNDESPGVFALVIQAANHRVVTIGPEIDPDTLRCGDEVLLGPEMNVIVGMLPRIRALAGGETGTFDRDLGDGRVVVRWRDEEMILAASSAFLESPPKPGDALRWNRNQMVAYEALARSQRNDLFLEHTPEESFEEHVGGLDQPVAQLKALIELHVLRRDSVQRYELAPKSSCLLTGPPGNGKTLLARATANHLARLSPSGQSRFLALAPGELNSVWFGETERRYRDAFRAAREAASPESPTVIFIDEIDAVVPHRGRSFSGVEDRVTATILSELSGFRARGNVLLITATNRADMLDTAAVRSERLGDEIIAIPRPGRDGARAIFRKHLSPRVPFAESGDLEAVRDRLIGSAVDRIFAASGDADLATMTFRDGRQQAVAARDLLSGAAIGNIVREAKQRAVWREHRTGTEGLRREDLLEAVDDQFRQMARLLTPMSAHHHLPDLSPDVDVVRVAPIVRRARRTYRFVDMSAA